MKKILVSLLIIVGLLPSVAFAESTVSKHSALSCNQIERGYYFNIDALKALLEQYDYCIDYTETSTESEIKNGRYLCEFLFDHAEHVTTVIKTLAVLFKEKKCLGAGF